MRVFLASDESLHSFPRILKHITHLSQQAGVQACCALWRPGCLGPTLHGRPDERPGSGAGGHATGHRAQDYAGAAESSAASSASSYSSSASSAAAAASSRRLDAHGDRGPGSDHRGSDPPSPSLVLLLYNCVGHTRVPWTQVVAYVLEQQGQQQAAATARGKAACFCGRSVLIVFVCLVFCLCLCCVSFAVPPSVFQLLLFVRESCASPLTPPGDVVTALRQAGVRATLPMDYHAVKGFRVTKDNTKAYENIVEHVQQLGKTQEPDGGATATRSTALARSYSAS